MPALPADISAGTREAQIETWTSATIKARYARARDNSDAPSDGYFDSAADADTALTARAALIGVERRRFSIVVEGLHWIAPGLGTPTVTLIDPENGVNAAAMVTRVEVDLDAERTTFEVFV